MNACRPPVTAAYVYDREGLVLRDADAASLDQLNFSFALIRDGVVSGDHWRNIAAYTDYIRRHPHILPVVSVGGWGADGFSQAASSAEGRALFTQSALALMEEHGFLGIDIDWEYPCRDDAGIAASPDDRENFTLLLESLKNGLDALTARDGRPRLLAAALGAHPSLVDAIDCARVGELLDQVNLMTYDIQTAFTLSHLAALYGSDRFPLSADDAVRFYTQAGIPQEKIMIGNAFYARLFTAEDEARNVPFAPATDRGTDTVRYRDFIAQEGWQHAFDDAACAAYATRGARFATYDSPASIAKKGEYVRQNGLMGMMCWEYGSDRDGELLGAMHASLNHQD